MFEIVLSVHLCLLFAMLHGLGAVNGSSRCVNSCPAVSRGFRYFSNTYLKYRGTSFHCQFHWTNRVNMIEKVADRIKHRHKQFLRFKVPAFHLDPASGAWERARDEFETWVWVSSTHEYMLYFPHNFNVISLGTMGIITNNFWEPDGEGDLFGYCDDGCVKFKMATHRCALTRDDVLSFMSDVTKDKIEWNYVCRQLDYDVTDVIRNPNSAFPDLFYYWRFLWQLFSRRPYFGKCTSRDDFIHYHCFDKNGQLNKKELLMNYYVVSLLAVILWSYSPLLVHYLPSSKPTGSNYPPGLNAEDFLPTSKSPVYFVKLVRCALGFYIQEYKGVKSRLRRLVFYLCSFVILTRFLYTPYSAFFVAYICVFVVAVFIPEQWSVWLGDGQPTHFLDLWKYPEEVFRKNTRAKEYQFLAHCMKERVFLMLELRLWKMLCVKSFESPHFSDTWTELCADYPMTILELVLSVFAGAVTLVYVSLLTLVYHFVPALYFYKKIFLAIFNATRHSLIEILRGTNSPLINALTSIVSLICSVILVGYFMIAAMFCCYLVAEVTMFTYIGAVLDPSMAFNYVSLVGAISFVLHGLAKDLRESYDRLRDQIVDTLQGQDHLSHVNNARGVNLSGVLERKVEPDGTLRIFLKIDSQAPRVVLYRDHFTTYLSRPLLDFCIEESDPVRRQMFFIAVKVLLMTFYISIALWIKNVFHKEKDVSSIFVVARDIAMNFVPSLLQLLAHQSRQGGKDTDVDVHRRVHEAIATYVTKEQALAAAGI